eukprot:g16914.t3
MSQLGSPKSQSRPASASDKDAGEDENLWRKTVSKLQGNARAVATWERGTKLVGSLKSFVPEDILGNFKDWIEYPEGFEEDEVSTKWSEGFASLPQTPSQASSYRPGLLEPHTVLPEIVSPRSPGLSLPPQRRRLERVGDRLMRQRTDCPRHDQLKELVPQLPPDPPLLSRAARKAQAERRKQEADKARAEAEEQHRQARRGFAIARFRAAGFAILRKLRSGDEDFFTRLNSAAVLPMEKKNRGKQKERTAEPCLSTQPAPEAPDKEPEPEKDPAEVQAEEEMAREAQAAELPRVERGIAEQQRRRLHNALQDMKGQLRVSCRIRPLSAKERAKNSEHAVFARLGDQEDGEGRPCGVTVCGSALELYNNHFIDLLRPIDKTGRQSPGVKVCVDSEGCVEVDGLAQIPAADPQELLQILRKGLHQRVVAEHAMNADSSRSHMVFTVRLNPQKGVGAEPRGRSRKLTFCDLGGCERLKRTHVVGDLQKEVCVDSEGCVEVDGLAQIPAADPQELLQILRKGLHQRVVAEHAMNADSSRSHMVFTVRLNPQKGVGAEPRGRSRKLTFCDLGGCERLKRTHVVGDLQKEAIEINKSLSALSSVIEAVAGKRRHVPY